MSVERSAPRGAVFLSYASQDADAARKICDALRVAEVEVWLDQDGGLVGGDAWDAKIRGQIASCALFVPIISANTQARLEGYFRLEWKLAAQRTHTMAEEKAFLLPVVIDATRDAEAKVPAEFKAVQWTRLPQGETALKFCERVKGLIEDGQQHLASSTGSAPQIRKTSLPMNRHRRGWVFALAAVAIAAVAVAVWRPLQSQGKVTRETITATVAPTSAQPDSKSIAVLAFANMSADKENNEYFSDGISDEILNALDRNPALRVTPRTSSFSFKGRNVPLEEIGRTLRVASVIEGSVKKAGNEVRITVKLLNAATGSRVWSEEFVRQLTTADIFAVQSEIAAKVAAKLGGAAIAPAASVSFPAGAQTNNLEAHDFYLRGLALQMAPQMAATQLEIVKLYQEATRRDPGYALAWARMSEMLLALRSSHFDRGPETTAKALDAAATAMRLAPHLPEAQLAVARVRLNINGEHDATQQALDEVARLAPNNAEAALLRAELERARGRWDKALVQLCARAAELDPQNAVALNRAAALLNTIGEFAEADRLSRRSWDLSPTGTLAIRRLASIRVAWTGDVKDALEPLNSLPAPLRADGLVAALRAGMYELLGDPSSAVGAYEEGMRYAKAYTTSGPRGYPIMVGYNLARLQPDRATAHLNEALHLAHRFVIDFPDLDDGPRYLARIHAARGEKEAALAAVADATARVARTKYAVQIAAMRRLRAEVLALLGDNDAAIAELQAVHGMGYGFGYTLRLEPAWARLRGKPKFQQLMKAAEARADAQPRPKK